MSQEELLRLLVDDLKKIRRQVTRPSAVYSVETDVLTLVDCALERIEGKRPQERDPMERHIKN
jgi:hypothetical protein